MVATEDQLRSLCDRGASQNEIRKLPVIDMPALTNRMNMLTLFSQAPYFTKSSETSEAMNHDG